MTVSSLRTPGHFRLQWGRAARVRAALLLVWLALPVWAELLPGSAIVSEPCLMQRNDILYFEDFERTDVLDEFGHYKYPEDYARTSSPDEVFKGEASLQVSHFKDSHRPYSLMYNMHEVCGSGCPDVLHIRFYVIYPEDYDFGKGEKIHGVYAYKDGVRPSGAGVKPTGTDKYSCKVVTAIKNGKAVPALYYYHPEQPGIYGQTSHLNVGSPFHIEPGRWYCFELMLKANNPPQKDGELKMWVDGELKAHYQNIRFRDVAGLKLNQIEFTHYFGGSWTCPKDQFVFDDNLVVAGSYIGPYKEATELGNMVPISPAISEVSKETAFFDLRDRLLTVQEETVVAVFDLTGGKVTTMQSGEFPATLSRGVYVAVPSNDTGPVGRIRISGR